MKIIIFPTYFPSISHFVAMVQSEGIVFETDDNFQKQTNRNRAYIYSPNGKQLLNIPVKHSKNTHQKTKDIRVENDFGWQKQHFKSLEAAYRSSPFFEFFEDDIRHFFDKKQSFLIDLNFESIELAAKCLRFSLKYDKTTEYFHQIDTSVLEDFRTLANGKKDTFLFPEYTQVFQEKEGFINNLSILDLIFNEGKYALEYIKKGVLKT